MVGFKEQFTGINWERYSEVGGQITSGRHSKIFICF
jgi:hypothetical protein